MKHFTLILFTLIFFACNNTKKTTPKTTSHTKTINTKTTTCQLIEKEFTHKGGDLTEHKEFYLRCSIQDYFIKICESSITKEQLKPYINKGIEVKMEIKTGLLDHCEAIPEYAQSRTGTYVIITKIIE
ncbi:MAG: hypothetical protein JKY30_00950 [Flavobacteriales bacterium]|nr:hypothetical protein [Flavobacteriales bacterium]